MSDVTDPDLYRRTQALLEPGDIELVGLVVHTSLGSDEEPEMHQATVEVGNIVAANAGYDPSDTHVYSGNDDPEFGLNQHQGRTVDDEFVWECQQLLRDGTYDIVFYYEADTDQEAIIQDVRDLGFEAMSVQA